MIKYTTQTNFSVVNYWQHLFPTIHTHDFWEILFVTEGSLINTLNGFEHKMNVGDIALIYPTSEHKLSYIPEIADKPVKYYNLIISTNYMKEICDKITPNLYSTFDKNQNLYATLSPDRQTKMLNIFRFARSIINQEEQSIWTRTAANILITEFIDLTQTTINNTVSEKALRIMSAPSNMQLTIREIAYKLGYSAEHFSRIFKKEQLKSPHEVYNSIKMNYAVVLLKQTELTVEEIADYIGINSISFFYRAFKKYHNCVPNSFRKKTKITN